MFKKFLILFFSLTIMLLAQHGDKDQLYFVHEDIVKPDMYEKYEEASKGFVDLFKELKVPRMSRASMTNDLRYFYITPIDSYSDIDKSQKEWEQVLKNAPEGAMEKAYAKFEGCYDIHKDYIVKYKDALSYWPDEPRISNEEIKYLNWGFYWFKDGSGKKVTGIAKKFKQAYLDNDIKDGFSIYTSDLGMDRNLWIVVNFGKSEEDFYKQQAINSEKLKESVKDLRKELRSVMLKYEEANGWRRPDLSYYPEK